MKTRKLFGVVLILDNGETEKLSITMLNKQALISWLQSYLDQHYVLCSMVRGFKITEEEI